MLASVGQFSTSSGLIEALVYQGKKKILGAALDLSTGRVNYLEIQILHPKPKVMVWAL